MALRRKGKSIRPDRKMAIEQNAMAFYLSRYLEALKVKGYSLNTQRRRDGNLRRFIRWCSDRGIDEPSAVTKQVAERYQRFLYYYRKASGEPLAFNSQQVMLSSVRSFFAWLTKENYLPSNPASEIELPKVPQQLPRTILRREQIEAILAQPNVATPEGLRDRAIMELFYACGMRRSELAHLKVYDADTQRQILMIRAGKGDKDRVLPLGERALAWLEKYLADVRALLESPKDQAALFLTDYGEPYPADMLGQLVKRHMKSAGIDAKGSCHLFRHAMATHMLDNGADIRYIQTMLGHAKLTTTEIYTHVSIEKLREVHARTHPGARLARDSEACAGLNPEAEVKSNDE